MAALGTWAAIGTAVAVLGSGGGAGGHALQDAVASVGRHVTHRQARPVPHLPTSCRMPSGHVPAVLSTCQIITYAYRAGFRGRDLQTACAVAFAESAAQPRQQYFNHDRHHSIDKGVWQINSYWNADALRMGDWRDPAMNARMAYRIRHTVATGWGDWVTYKHGSHLQFMNRCGRAAA